MAMPLIKPTIRKIRFPDELTAASALLPRKFPTMRESAVLYNCWNRFPRNDGIAKKMIFWEILPSVILRLFFIAAITLPSLSSVNQWRGRTVLRDSCLSILLSVPYHAHVADVNANTVVRINAADFFLSPRILAERFLLYWKITE